MDISSLRGAASEGLSRDMERLANNKTVQAVSCHVAKHAIGMATAASTGSKELGDVARIAAGPVLDDHPKGTATVVTTVGGVTGWIALGFICPPAVYAVGIGFALWKNLIDEPFWK